MPEVDKIIRFPLVMTNNGRYYDPSDSIFTCPISGTYYFTFSLYTSLIDGGRSTSAYIQRDGDSFSRVLCLSYIPDFLYTHCGNSAVIHCQQGQHVFLTSGGYNNIMQGVDKRSTFSGFLIHEDVPPY